MRVLLLLFLIPLAACGGNRDEDILARALDLPADVGTICDMQGLLGKEIEDINGGSGGGCGVSDPVKVYAVGGVKLNAQPRINCKTALALNSWVRGPAQDAARESGTLITEMRVVAGYACRRRNNRPRGKLSEHARGNAVDIAALTLSNGDTVSVLKDWGSRKYSKLMRRLHATACGP
ncbi:MAG: extensin family protein, partial [Pseudomonadota bacterium]